MVRVRVKRPLSRTRWRADGWCEFYLRAGCEIPKRYRARNGQVAIDCAITENTDVSRNRDPAICLRGHGLVSTLDDATRVGEAGAVTVIAFQRDVARASRVIVEIADAEGCLCSRVGHRLRG